MPNHMSASGLWLAPALTHTLSDQWDGRGAGDTVSCLFPVAGGFPYLLLGL